MPDVFVSTPEEKEIKNPTAVLKKPSGSAKHKLTGHSHNPLSAFCYFPDGVDFETKSSEEKVVLLLRRHPITNIPWITVFILMLIAPFFLGIFPILSFLPDNFQLVAVMGWYAVTVILALEGFLTWFFNVNIITDERVVDIDFHNLIYKEVSDTKVDNIQDVTYKMGGVIRTIFNYGDVQIQTAAEVPEFEFLAVPKPDRVAKVLQDLVMEEEQEKIEGRVR